MIGSLKGIVSAKEEDKILLDVGGVGYEVYLTIQALEKAIVGQDLFLMIYTAVREDSLTLFGFLTPQEKKVFLLLISVSGIGPRLAINILAGISFDGLLEAISKKDLVKLTSISGIGKKTAERIVLELQDKVLKQMDLLQIENLGSFSSPLADDVLSALLNLGYHRQGVEKVLSKIKWDTMLGFEQALKEALQVLSRN